MTLNFLLLMPITYLAFRQTPNPHRPAQRGAYNQTPLRYISMNGPFHFSWKWLFAFDGIKIFVASPGAESTRPSFL